MGMSLCDVRLCVVVCVMCILLCDVLLCVVVGGCVCRVMGISLCDMRLCVVVCYVHFIV